MIIEDTAKRFMSGERDFVQLWFDLLCALGEYGKKTIVFGERRCFLDGDTCIQVAKYEFLGIV